MTNPPLRFGILGAARIAPMALVRPAREGTGVEVVAVAARDERRARAFARRHRIPRTHGSYAALLADPEVDAVYVPLPNSLHAEWTIRALEAGKHVLCEKPLASNAAEAALVIEAAHRSGRLLIEAFHWRHHPLAARMREIVTSGELGEIRRVETAMCIPLPLPGDIRYRLDLGGGATMDTGCYAIDIARFLAAAEPEVISATARLSSPRVDRWMRAELRFPGGVEGRATCALFSATLVDVRARVVGSRGELRVFNPVAPHLFHRLSVVSGGAIRRERIEGDTTYSHQLSAFAAAVRGEREASPSLASSLANMRAIDAVYDAAGLGLRGT
ncbi:MAG: Gfo/Idh/MocA family oxidoreductase [Deltaproteobacteria bacterium]|nr:Gfo/Idh/MocA family oxidoreductase [Deltaproteobacteria bacterium]